MTPENAFVTSFESSDVDLRHSLDRPTDPFCGWRSKSVAGAARLGFGTAPPCAAEVFLYSVRGIGPARGGRGSKTAFKKKKNTPTCSLVSGLPANLEK